MIDIEIFKIFKIIKNRMKFCLKKERQHEERYLQMQQENENKKPHLILIFHSFIFFWNRLPEELAEHSLLKVKTPSCTSTCLSPRNWKAALQKWTLGVLMDFRASNLS